ncbi:hypothetical protein DV735_g3175, partial [Chaetothyriales sp. CBS 134920]
MLSAPALEVRSVIGGIILILPITPQQLLLLLQQAPDPSSSASPEEGLFADYLRTVHSLRERIEDESVTARDVAKIRQQLKELAGKMESWCHDEGIFGLDFVFWDGLPHSPPPEEGNVDDVERNEFGEKVGIHRVKEVLESIDWTDDPGAAAELEDSSNLDRNINNSGLDVELQQEIMGLKLSMLDLAGRPSDDDEDEDDGQDMSPSEMQELMERVVAIRDAGAGLPKEEREAFANREVGKIIRELM